MVNEDDWRLFVGQEPFEFEHTDSRISKVVTSMLRRGKSHTPFAMDAVGHVTLAEIFEVACASDANFKRMQGYGQQSGVSPRGFIGFPRTEKCRFFVIGKRAVGDECWTLWKARATEGQSIEGVDVDATAYYLTNHHESRLPAICHGTRRAFAPSILGSGLSLASKQSVMLSMFRIGTLVSVKDSVRTPTSRRRLSSCVRSGR